MRYTGDWYPDNYADKVADKLKTADFLRIRGTSRAPDPPRDVFIQSGPRGLFVTWKLPDPDLGDIVGWRIYKGDENTLFDELRDRGVRQRFIEATSGATPPVTSLFVSSMNQLGNESQKVQALGSATTEAGAPSMPSVPPGYNDEDSGGADVRARAGSWKFSDP